MELKKNPKRDLNQRSTALFMFGLVVALSLVLFVMNYKSYDNGLKDLGRSNYQLDEEQAVQEVRLQMPKPPPPPPPPPTRIQVVENDQKVEDVVIKSVDIEDTPVDIVDTISDVGEQVDNTTYVFAVVESKPVYPGCGKYKTETAKYECFERSIQRDLKKYLDRHLDPERAGSGGRSFVQFVIGKDGHISKVQAARAPNDYLEKLAVDAVKSLPRITPAKQRGQPVNVRYTLPVSFHIQ